MYTEIIKAECSYNKLLPLTRLTISPGVDLMTAAKIWCDAVWDKARELGPIEISADQVTKGLLLAQHPVFICGVHRSGTTLVRDLLDGHPKLVVLPSEGTYYTNLEQKILAIPEIDRSFFLGKEWLRRLANPINQSPYWLLGRSNEAGSSYVEFARYVMSWWEIVNQKEYMLSPQVVIMFAYASCTRQIGAQLWVDKTPTNERFIGRIRKEFPEAKIIHIIRNPSAVLASRKKLHPSFNIKGLKRNWQHSILAVCPQHSGTALKKINVDTTLVSC